MADKQNQNEQQQSVREENLDQVSGGAVHGWAGRVTPVVHRDTDGNPTHWRAKGGQIFYFVCPHCGRLLHQGLSLRMYCDPCDESWFGITLASKGCKRYE